MGEHPIPLPFYGQFFFSHGIVSCHLPLVHIKCKILQGKICHPTLAGWEFFFSPKRWAIYPVLWITGPPFAKCDPVTKCDPSGQTIHKTSAAAMWAPNMIFNSSPPEKIMAAIPQTILYRCIFFNEAYLILFKVSLKFVPKGPPDHNPALVEIMAWSRICAHHPANQLVGQLIQCST